MLAEFFNPNQFNPNFLLGFLSIVLIDIVLSGDNAVVIAMAVQGLPDRKRRLGIVLGAGAAVGLRICFTFFASQLLGIPVIKLAGGILILWIGVKLLREGTEEEGGHKEAETLWHAIWIILIADASMSLDNILAVAGASGGSLSLLIFGLCLSIPIVVFTSNLMSILMKRYPMVIYIGAAVLGRVGGEMIITDPYLCGLIRPAPWVEWSVQAFFTVAVLAAGRWRSILRWVRHTV